MSRCFFSPSTHRIHAFDIPEAEGHALLSSSNGWLALLSQTLDVWLLNPITRIRSHGRIPRIDGFLYGLTSLASICGGCYAFLNSSTDGVIAFCDTSSCLYYCGLGDEDRISVPLDIDCVMSLEYHGGRFYVANDITLFQVYDVGSAGDRARSELGFEAPMRFAFFVKRAHELLLVGTSDVEDVEGKDEISFEVYKVDDDGGNVGRSEL